MARAVVRATRIPARVLGVASGLAFFAVAWVYYGLIVAPALFPLRTIVTIPEGMGLRDVAVLLERTDVVRNAQVFALTVSLKDGEEKLQAGDYFFDRKLSVLEVADRLMAGEYGLTPIKITIPEGAPTYRIADVLGAKLGKFDRDTFMHLARDKEGYLFPDTYYILPNATASQVLGMMEQNFYDRVQPLQPKIAAFGRPIHEVITMASLIEKEAHRTEDRELISGILWNRIEADMPLQVDAVFGYINERDTFSPKYSDLEADSPYNTYRHRGLPPGPIANPGLAAIEAAVAPRETDALYYLHGKDGTLHIAATFDEHVANRRRYLR